MRENKIISSIYKQLWEMKNKNNNEARTETEKMKSKQKKNFDKRWGKM